MPPKVLGNFAVKSRDRKKYIEFSLSFSSGNQRLFGKLLLPEEKGPLPAAILCHGFGTDHRTMRPVAKIIAQRGVAAFIFDFRGHGWSGGTCDGNAWEDVIAAFNHLFNVAEINKERISIIGHSMGAGAALLAAPKLENIYALVLISCPPDGVERSGEEFIAFYKRLAKYARGLVEYPRQGLPPWVRSFSGLGWLWMKLRRYRVIVDWEKMFKANQKGALAAALTKIKNCQLLFVHCQGDKFVDYHEVLRLYEYTESPKKVMLAPDGSHSTPLFPGRLRHDWLNWLIAVLQSTKEKTPVH